MIKSFRNKDTQRLWEGRKVRQFQAFRLRALRRLDVLNAATRHEDLMRNPGNRFEKLSGGRRGQFSIRINRQWRVCFRWEGRDAFDVEITDYH